MPSIVAVILGGGRGTRLLPLTRDRSKPAVPLAGKYRLIDIPVSNCINSNIRNIYVLTQFNSASLNQHISRAYRFDQFSRGFVEVLAAEQTVASGDWFQGTADAVRQNYQHLADDPAEHVLILSGDHLYSMDYSKFLHNHLETDADISIAVQPVKAEDAPQLGILKTDSKSGRIVQFCEKPAPEILPELAVDTAKLGLDPKQAQERPHLGSMGVYLFKWKALGNALNGMPDAIDFGKEIIPQSINTLNVQAYLFSGYWADIGTISAYFKANLDFCSVLPKFNLFNPDYPVYTNTRFLPPAKVRGGIIEDCIVSEGSIIDGGIIKRSILGVRSRIFADVNMANVVMLGCDQYESAEMAQSSAPRFGVGEGTTVRNAIIDKDASIGKGVRLTNQENKQEYYDPEGRFIIQDGIIVVPKKAVIPHEFCF